MKKKNLDLLIIYIHLAVMNDVPGEMRTKESVQEIIDRFTALAPKLYSDDEPLSDAQKRYVIEKVFNDVNVILPEGITITDTSSDFKPWLSDRRADIEFDFWNRYKEYLLIKKGWASAIVNTLDKDSDRILELLGNPVDTVNWTRHGLMIGEVQAGKTANYTAVINKAVDAGFQVIIVLTGITENLRRQTQERLDKEFVGRSSDIATDRIIGLQWKPIGVGSVGNYTKIKKWPISFTSTTSDLQSTATNQISQVLKQDDIYLFVLKKNKSVLGNLNDWLTTNNPKKERKIELSVLLIDDESDNASVNTNKNEIAPTAINAEIRKILAMFARSSYLAVTATPYANIFIDGEVEDETHASDLFPKDYIHLLETSNEYVGAMELFGETASAKSKRCIKLIPTSEIEEKIPLKHKKGQLHIESIKDLPKSLVEAVRYFLLVQALADYNYHVVNHRSMLINVSRFTDTQNDIRDVLDVWLRNDVWPSVRNFHAMPELASRQDSGEFHLFRKVWDDYNLEATSKIKWEDFSRETLWTAISKVTVVSVNQKSEALIYDTDPNGLRVITVGGFSLSRGLTLEGLLVSYFYRNSRAYDTLMQMGRWFGYRSHYLDYFKLWMAPESVLWYQTIVEATRNLRHQIKRMNRLKRTPAQFGLAIQRQPLSRLLITARNKMRNTQEGSTLPVIISGHLIETPRLYNSAQINQENGALIKNFVFEISSLGRKESDDSIYYLQSAHLWHDVPKEKISDLVQKFQSHKWNQNYQAEGLSRYIIDDTDDLFWDVALITKGDDKAKVGKEVYATSYGDIEILRQLRTASLHLEDNQIKIGKKSVRVGPGKITKIGLTHEQISEIIKKHNAEPSGTKDYSDADLLVPQRPPILLLYTLALRKDEELERVGNIDKGESVYAIGLGFPQLGPETKDKYVQYVLNPVAARAFLGFSDDELDEGEDDE